MQTTSLEKSRIRSWAKAHRGTLASEASATKLTTHFPKLLNQVIVGGFAPIGHEIDLWPLLKHLQAAGRTICLPVTPETPGPLKFRQWTPGCQMETDRYGVPFPTTGEKFDPQLILVPLLAYTNKGERLGYGGGYYDRTLNALRQTGDVFACGVAYAGQEMSQLSTDEHDERLDGILTETGFKAFT